MLPATLLSYLNAHMVADAKCKPQHINSLTIGSYAKEPGITLIVCYDVRNMSDATWALKSALEQQQLTYKLMLNKGKIFTGTGMFWFIPAEVSLERIQGIRFTRVLEYD